VTASIVEPGVVTGELQAVVTAQRQRAGKRKRLKEESQKKYGHIFRGQSEQGTPVSTDNPVPLPPFWGRRIATAVPLKHVYPYINLDALFKSQWGYKQGSLDKDQYEQILDEKARPVFELLQRRAIEEGLLEPKVVYGYFPAAGDGDDVILEVAPGVDVRYIRRAVMEVISGGDDEETETVEDDQPEDADGYVDDDAHEDADDHEVHDRADSAEAGLADSHDSNLAKSDKDNVF